MMQHLTSLAGRRGGIVAAARVHPHANGVRSVSSALSVVLLKSEEGLGVKGEEKQVKPGYMRNFLYPNGIAVYGTPENISKFKTVDEDDTSTARKAFKKEMSKFEKKLSAIPISIRRNTVDGKTCSPGEVTPKNVVDKALKQRGIALEPARITLLSIISEGPLEDDDDDDEDGEVVEEVEEEIEAEDASAESADPEDVPTFPLNTIGKYRAFYAFNPALAMEAAGLAVDSQEATADIMVKFTIDVAAR
mmetsp:Transcript_68694/g.117915  ORF Transcript_68694/g.117915 Transcript_68694/m.117915 type:complete len:248 (+) Transcript_68694:3-746(+)